VSKTLKEQSERIVELEKAALNLKKAIIDKLKSQDKQLSKKH